MPIKKYLYKFLLTATVIAICISAVHAQVKNQIIQQARSTNIGSYINRKNWDELFPHRKGAFSKQTNKYDAFSDFYSYDSFVAACGYFPSFLSAPGDETNKRELCAFLANMSYETGGGWDEAPGGYYKWGLYFTEERNCENGCPQYSDTTKQIFPPVRGRSYHGRGGLQLSWNYNYGQFSEWIFGNKEKLLQEPDLVSKDPLLAFSSALWFWTTPQYPKPSCHSIITNAWQPNALDTLSKRLPGFGAIINVINGGIECNKPVSGAVNYRQRYYFFFCHYFNVDPGTNSGCTEQMPFGVAGS